MAIFQRKLNQLADRMSLRQFDEEQSRRAAQRSAALNNQYNNLGQDILSGIASLQQMQERKQEIQDAKDEKEANQMLEFAKYVDPGELEQIMQEQEVADAGQGAEPIRKVIPLDNPQDINKKVIPLEADAAIDGFIPKLTQEEMDRAKRETAEARARASAVQRPDYNKMGINPKLQELYPDDYIMSSVTERPSPDFNKMGINPKLQELYPDQIMRVPGQSDPREGPPPSPPDVEVKPTEVKPAVDVFNTNNKGLLTPNPTPIDAASRAVLQAMPYMANATPDQPKPADAGQVPQAPAKPVNKELWDSIKSDDSEMQKADIYIPTSQLKEKDYKPLKWKVSEKEQAKNYIDQMFKARGGKDQKPDAKFENQAVQGANDFFNNLFSAGDREKKTAQVRLLAEKIAEKAIREQRRALENENLKKFQDEVKLDIDKEKLKADSTLKAAQARKAAMTAGGSNVMRFTGNVQKDMLSATEAMEQARIVKIKYDGLIKGEGMPLQKDIRKVISDIKAASAHQDASSMSGGVGGNIVVGANASASKSAGGKYIDDKVIEDAIKGLDNYQMTDAQRSFVRESLLLAQKVGKTTEGGKLTDKDLDFYVENLFAGDSPESFNESFKNRYSSLIRTYNSLYKSYLPDNPNLRVAFRSPESYLEQIGDLDWTPERFGFDRKTFEERLKQQKAAEDMRVSSVKKEVKGSQKKAGKLGFTPPAPNLSGAADAITGQLQSVIGVGNDGDKLP